MSSTCEQTNTDSLDTIPSLELEQLKEKTLKLQEQALEDYHQYQRKSELILVELQRRCQHIWEKQSDSGPYPQRWWECTNCGLVK